ncbi:MAG: hypothetical protein ACRDCY_07950, partial [Aeromonas veronii]
SSAQLGVTSKAGNIVRPAIIHFLTIEHSPSLSYRYKTGSVSLIESVANRKVLLQPARITPAPSTGRGLHRSAIMTVVTDGRRHHLTDKRHKVSQKLKLNKIK